MHLRVRYSDEIHSENFEPETAGGVFDVVTFRLFVLCLEHGDLGLLEQPTAQTRQRMFDIRRKMWDLVEDICTANAGARKPEVVSSCIGASVLWLATCCQTWKTGLRWCVKEVRG